MPLDATDTDAARPLSDGEGTPPTVSRPELLAGGSDQNFRKLVHDFFAFNARHEAIRDGHARRIGLAGIEYTILISIARLSADGDVNVKALAEHLHVSIGFITNTTRKLQEMGLVTKTPDPEDKRRIILAVTPEGRARLEQLAPWQRQVNDVEFGGLTAEEFRLLGRIVERLVETSEAAVELQRELEGGDEAA
jgi:DNA-binding MarR family transcriptional regulator